MVLNPATIAMSSRAAAVRSTTLSSEQVLTSQKKVRPINLRAMAEKTQQVETKARFEASAKAVYSKSLTSGTGAGGLPYAQAAAASAAQAKP